MTETTQAPACDCGNPACTFQYVAPQGPQPGMLTANQLRPILGAVLAQLETTADRVDAKELQSKIRAAQKAFEKLLLGAWFDFDPAAQVAHFESASEPGTRHETTPDTCDCRGASEGRCCWHRAARVLLWRLCLELGQVAPERFWVVCTDGQECGTARQVTEHELEDLQENAQTATDGTWWWVKVAGPMGPLPAEPESESPAPVYDLAQMYRCPSCKSAMVHTTTPGGDPCVECINGNCQNSYMDGYEYLVVLSEAEAAGVARVLGLARKAA